MRLHGPAVRARVCAAALVCCVCFPFAARSLIGKHGTFTSASASVPLLPHAPSTRADQPHPAAAAMERTHRTRGGGGTTTLILFPFVASDCFRSPSVRPSLSLLCRPLCISRKGTADAAAAAAASHFNIRANSMRTISCFGVVLCAAAVWLVYAAASATADAGSAYGELRLNQRAAAAAAAAAVEPMPPPPKCSDSEDARRGDARWRTKHGSGRGQPSFADAAPCTHADS